MALASVLRTTVWLSTLNCGSPTTTPSTVTQPPSMNSSASLREQPTSSIRRLERRMGSVMRKAVTERKGAYCTHANTVNRGNIENAWRISVHLGDFYGGDTGLLLNPTLSGAF